MPVTVVKVRCQNCGAEPSIPAELVTLAVDLAEDRAAVVFACQLCGTPGESYPLIADIQQILLDAGCQLAAREV